MAPPTHSPLYAHSYNALLDLFRREAKAGEPLPGQAALAESCGASRTTVHRILRGLKRAGLVEQTDGKLWLARRPTTKDFLPEPRVLSRREEVERNLMEMLVQGRLKPGERFSELALARQHNVTTGTIREALLRMAPLGVFAKAARKQWEVALIDGQMINELMDIRTLVETFSLRQYFQQPARRRDLFSRVYTETRALAESARPDRTEFFRLDAELHRQILVSSGNRYLAEQFKFVAFPIQIQFVHSDFDADRQRLGLAEHLGILQAIVDDNGGAAVAALENHLRTARETLLRFEAARVKEQPKTAAPA